MTIIGETGTVKIGGTAVNSVEQWSFAEYDDDDKLVDTSAINTTPPTIYGFGHEGYYRNVVDVLAGAADAGTDGHASKKSLALILAIHNRLAPV